MISTVSWANETPHLFCASWVPSWGVRRHLIVEALPGGGWDWAVWTADDSGRSLSGEAASAVQAMRAAERGALMLATGPMAGLSAAQHLQSDYRRAN